MAFIAAYDTPDAGDYERDIVRIAKTWRRIMVSPHNIQGIVDRLVDELDQEPPEHYGAAWHDLKAKFMAWAMSEEWLGGRGT